MPPFAHPVFPFFFVAPVVWFLVIGLVVFLVARSRRRGAWSAQRSAEAVLAEHFAHGEVDEDEYRSRLEVLRETRAPAGRISARAGGSTRT